MAGVSGNLFSGGATVVKIGGPAGHDVGFTKDGIRISRQTDYLDFEVDQNTSIMKKQVTLTRMMLNTVFAEGTLDNIRRAWQIPTAALVSNSLQLRQSDASSANEFEIYFEGITVQYMAQYVSSTAVWANLGSGTAAVKRVYHFYRCIALADSEVQLNRGVETNVPFNVECMIDNTKSPARWGDIYDSAT
jgi:hypothetical protein